MSRNAAEKPPAQAIVQFNQDMQAIANEIEEGAG